MTTINLANYTTNPYYQYLFNHYDNDLDNVISVIIKDEYYKQLSKKYNEYDIFNLINMITEDENCIREKYEMDCSEAYTKRFNKV